MTRSAHLCVVMVVLSCVSAQAAITVSHDTAWGPDSVKLADSVRINDGVTLTIQPATVVCFSGTGTYAIWVNGRILAGGTKQDSITFTSNSSSYKWHGIRFIKTPWTNDTSRLAYCRLENAQQDYFNPGGAVAIDSFPKVNISNCTIANNGASGGNFYGGGIYVRKAAPRIINCSIVNNHADGSASDGGAVYCQEASPVIIGTLFYRNTSYGAADAGGAVYCNHSSPLFVNCTFVQNKCNGAAGFGAAIACYYQSSPVIINSILWGNLDDQIWVTDSTSRPVVRNCDIGGGTRGLSAFFGFKGVWGQIMSLDPRFVKPDSGDLTLLSASPCINKGIMDTFSTMLPAYDLAGNPRISGGIVDLGAYEFQGTPVAPQVTIVSPTGGEVWDTQHPHDITWTATDNSTIVARSILASLDNGVTWTRIDSQATQSTSWSWTIPSADTSHNCLIAVIVYDNDGSQGWGMSPTSFSIISSNAGTILAHPRAPLHALQPVIMLRRLGGTGAIGEVYLPLPGLYSVSLTDARGKRLFSQTVRAARAGNFRIDLCQLAPASAQGIILADIKLAIK